MAQWWPITWRQSAAAQGAMQRIGQAMGSAGIPLVAL